MTTDSGGGDDGVPTTLPISKALDHLAQGPRNPNVVSLNPPLGGARAYVVGVRASPGLGEAYGSPLEEADLKGIAQAPPLN